MLIGMSEQELEIAVTTTAAAAATVTTIRHVFSLPTQTPKNDHLMPTDVDIDSDRDDNASCYRPVKPLEKPTARVISIAIRLSIFARTRSLRIGRLHFRCVSYSRDFGDNTMVALARAIGRVMRHNFQLHIAWLPLATPFRLGDYGSWRGGVFVPLGNVRDDFGIRIDAIDGGTIALDFVSKGVVLAEVKAQAQAQALSVPIADGEIGLDIRAKSSNSFVIKAPALLSKRISNIAAIASKLKNMRHRDDGPRWRARYKLVTEVFTGKGVTMLATTEADTTISLRGKAKSAHQLLGGQADASMSANKSLGLSFIGAEGPVALRLVRVANRGAIASFGDIDIDDSDLIIAEDSWYEDIIDDPEGTDRGVSSAH